MHSCSGSCNLVNAIIEHPDITSQEEDDLPGCRDFCKDQGAKYFSFKATESAGTAGECICGNRIKMEEMDPPHYSGKHNEKSICRMPSAFFQIMSSSTIQMKNATTLQRGRSARPLHNIWGSLSPQRHCHL